MQNPVCGIAVAVQVLAALRRLRRDEDHHRSGHGEGVGGLPQVGPVCPTRGSDRSDLNHSVVGIAVTVEVRVALAGLGHEGGEPPVGERDRRRRPPEIACGAGAGPQMNDLVGRVAVAV